MDDFKRALEKLKKIGSAKDENEMFQMFAAEQENFSTVQKEWFQSSIEKESVEAEHEDYLHEIIRYVNLLILMFQKAIPHKSLDQIVLSFSKEWTDGTEPHIYMKFDSSSWIAVIDELWQSDIKFDRTMKQECVNLSEMVWDEYRTTIDVHQLEQDAERICANLRCEYPSTEVSFLLKETL